MARETIRGVDHIGIYVPDIDTATQFFIEAFGAQVLYDCLKKSDPPIDLQASGNVAHLGIAPNSVLRAQRFLKLGNGPDLEVFEMHAPGQTASIGNSNFGLNHFATYADDITAAISRFTAAGGRMLFQPIPLPYDVETGEGNLFCYGVTPWGMTVEFMTYPSEMPYEKNTPLRRHHRGC